MPPSVIGGNMHIAFERLYSDDAQNAPGSSDFSSHDDDFAVSIDISPGK